MPDAKSKRAVFVDRDGVINVERDHVHSIEDFEVLPGAIDGLSALQRAGYALVVVTNQAGIGRGLYTLEQYESLTRYMVDMLAARGVMLAGVYHCPHHPTMGIGPYLTDCECRKPKPGMLLRAQRELHIDLGRSTLIGDKLADIAAGRAAGLPTCILVRSGHEVGEEDCGAADACLADLFEASRWIIGRERTLWGG